MAIIHRNTVQLSRDEYRLLLDTIDELRRAAATRVQVPARELALLKDPSPALRPC